MAHSENHCQMCIVKVWKDGMYPRRAGTVDKGRDFEDGMTALLLLRALRRWPHAKMATNVHGVDAFDDIVMLYPSGNEDNASALFIQLKHKNKDFRVSKNRLNGTNRDFGIGHYYKSFQNLWQNDELWERIKVDKYSTQFILYTNAKVPANRDASVEDNLKKFLNTGSPGYAHFLHGESHPSIKGPLANEFLHRFILCSEQSHSDLLKSVLQQEVMAHTGQLPELFDVCVIYAKRIQEENRKLGDISRCNSCCEKYNNNNNNNAESVQEEKTELMSLSWYNSLFEGYCKLQNWILERTRLPCGVHCNKPAAVLTGERIKEQLQQRNVVSIVMNKSSSQLHSCIVAQALKTFSSTPVLLADKGNLQDAVKLWRRAPSTLVLDEEALSLESVDLDLLKNSLSAEHRLLLLASAKGGAVSSALLADPPLFLDVSVADLSEESREALLATEVRLQGASLTVPFAHLAPESVWPSLGADVVSLLLRPGPPLELGRPLQPPPEYYIERELRQRVSININILKDSSVHDKFFIEGVCKQELRSVVHSKKLVGELQEIHKNSNLQYISVSEHDNFSLKKLDVWENQSMHYLSYSNNQLLLIDTRGNTHTLSKHKHEEGCTSHWPSDKIMVSENDILLTEFSRVGLSTDPGMGKSTFLLKLAKQLQEKHCHWWIVPLQLSKFCYVLRGMQTDSEDLMSSVQSLLESAINSSDQHYASLENKLLNHAVWTSGGCAILVDAFDEIAPDYTDIVGYMITRLAKSHVRVMWVTTRPVTRLAVTNALGGKIFTLQPLERTQQLQLMLKIWNMSDQTGKEEVVDIIDILAKTANSTKSIPVTGSPLTLFLLAKWMNKKDSLTRNLMGFTMSMNIFELYHALVQSAIESFHLKKLGKDLNLPAIANEVRKSKREHYDMHGLCALIYFLEPNDINESLSRKGTLEYVIKEIRLGNEKMGFIVDVVDDKPSFIYRTFAEFFAAWWLAKNWKNCQDMIQRLLNHPEMYFLRHFFHEWLVFEYPLHKQVFRKTAIPNNQQLNLKKHLDTKDMGDRTPLHVAALVGDSRMVEYLVGLGAKLEELGGVDNLTPLNYAVRMENWICLRALTDLGAVVENDISKTSYVEELNDAGVDTNWRSFEAHWPVVDGQDYAEKEKYSLLYAAALVGHERCFAWLKETCNVRNVDERILVTLLENKCSGFLHGCVIRSSFGGTEYPNEELLKAAKMGHLWNLEYALGRGAQINYCSPDGNTSLHVTARHGKTVLVAALARRGANTQARNKDGLTPKDLARIFENVDVEILIQNMESKILKESPFKFGLRLWDAASEGRLDRVKGLLLFGADTGVRRYPSGATALHEAAAKGFTDIVRLLCKSGADCEVKDAEGRHPLHLAAANGHSDIFNILISYGSDWKCATDDKSTPLHFACSKGEVNIIWALLQKRVEIDIKNKYGRSPLHVAAYNGHCAAIKVLLQAGADIFIKDYLDNTPLTAAAQSGHCRALVLLIKEQILIFGESVDYNNAVEAALQSRRINTAEILLALKDSKNENKVFELLEASVMGDVRKVQNMLNVHGNALFFHKYIPAAAFVAASNSHPEVIEFLFDAGFDVESRNKQQCSILHFAVTQWQPELVEMLLNRRANLDAKTINGLTPLMLAVVQGHDAVAVDLMEAGAEADDPEQLLCLAAKSGACEVVKKLLDGGVNCNAVKMRRTFPSSLSEDSSEDEDDEWSMSPLHLAAEKGHQKIVSALLKNRARVDDLSKKGETALHIAKRKGHTEVASLLLGAGVNKNIRNRFGRTAYDLTLKRKWGNLSDLTWF